MLSGFADTGTDFGHIPTRKYFSDIKYYETHCSSLDEEPVRR